MPPAAPEFRMALLELLRQYQGDRASDVLREGVRLLAEALMELEVSEQVGAGRYERSSLDGSTWWGSSRTRRRSCGCWARSWKSSTRTGWSCAATSAAEAARRDRTCPDPRRVRGALSVVHYEPTRSWTRKVHHTPGRDPACGGGTRWFRGSFASGLEVARSAAACRVGAR
jgi:hypothetical protein